MATKHCQQVWIRFNDCIDCIIGLHNFSAVNYSGLCIFCAPITGTHGSNVAKSHRLFRGRCFLCTGKADSNSTIGYEGLWRAHIRGTIPGGGAGEPQTRPPVPPQGFGSSLSTSDMEGVARFLEEFAVRVLLPHLEVRVRNLNHQVSTIFWVMSLRYSAICVKFMAIKSL